MTFVFALIVLLLVTFRGEAKKEDKDDKKAETGKNDLADIYKKLEEQIAVNEEFRKTESQLRKEVAYLRQADSLRQKEIAKLKMDDIKLRQADAQLRTADATMRKADAQLREADSKILDANKEVVERRESQRQERKRQDDVEAATRALIRSELKRYFNAHNNTEELEKLILSGIKSYQANGDRRLIDIAGGQAKWDSAANPSFPVEKIFGSSDGYGCGGKKTEKEEDYLKGFPQLIWYEFSSAHTPTRISFSSVDSGSTAPKTWRFVGSRDENCNQHSSWDQLCGDMSGNGKKTACDVPKYSRAPYRCLGIRVYSGNYENYDSRICIYGMKFWEIVWNNLGVAKND